MKKNQLVMAAVVAAFVGLLLFINRHEPARVAEERARAAQEAKLLAEQASGESQPKTLREKMRETASEADKIIRSRLAGTPMAEAATDLGETYLVEFICSNGSFVLEIYPGWSPLGAAQFKAAIEDGVFSEGRFFRVIPGFVVQWGIPGDPEKAAAWEKRTIQDEPVRTSNVRGTITFAKSQAPNSRTSQVFINFRDNTNLDGMGFSPFGKVVKGMEVVDAIFSGYGAEPGDRQGEIQEQGNAFLKEHYPKMDYIKEVKILGAAVETPPAAAATPEAAPEAAKAQE